MNHDVESGAQSTLPLEKSSDLKRKKSRVCQGWGAPLCIIGSILAVLLLWLLISAIVSSVEASRSLRMLKRCLNDTTLSESTTSLVIGDHSCNGEDFERLDLTKLKNLETFVVGYQSFRYVKRVKIQGLKHLKTISIGKESFTINREWYGNNPKCRFVLKDCPSLEQLNIGDYSFLEYTTCEMEQLPSLEVIEMRDLLPPHDSSSFYWASLSLKDLPRLRSLVLGNQAFKYAKEAVFEDLPGVRSIQFGADAVAMGSGETKLIMKELPQLESLVAAQNSTTFMNAWSIYLMSHMPSLTNVSLPMAFRRKHSVTVKNIGALQSYFE